jgi:hypothetical protein
MGYKIDFDWSKGIRGRLVLALVGDDGEIVDKEIMLKHPLLLRIRLRMAMRRIIRRQRKIRKFLKRVNA